jgi:hypothetical protein
MKKLQVVYYSDENNENMIHEYFKEEAEAKSKIGIMVGTKPNPEADVLLYRGYVMYDKAKYPKDNRFIQGYNEYVNYLYLSHYYPCIADITIETFFVDELNNDLPSIVKKRGWNKVFVKKESSALEHYGKFKSVWPDTSFEEMNNLFSDYNFSGKFGIRKYIKPELLENELRYWVLNGKIYRRDNIIPDIVYEAAARLNKMGSKYYTIDATPDIIIEVNPGESSDRHGENSPELFASWFKKEFMV